jgi:hypothetical protein
VQVTRLLQDEEPIAQKDEGDEAQNLLQSFGDEGESLLNREDTIGMERDAHMDGFYAEEDPSDSIKTHNLPENGGNVIVLSGVTFPPRSSSLPYSNGKGQ